MKQGKCFEKVQSKLNKIRYLSYLAKNNSATVLMEKNSQRNEQYWEFLKK